MSNRLTKEDRKDILRHAMRDIFEERVAALKKSTNLLAKEYYEVHFKHEAKKIEELDLALNWTPKHSIALQFSIDDGIPVSLWSKANSYHLRIEAKNNEHLYVVKELYRKYGDPLFCLGSAKLIPMEADSTITVQHRWKAKIINMQNKGIKLFQEETKLYEELEGFLFSCKTYKQVEDNWPEGAKYLPKKHRASNLPIPLVDNVRKAMKAAS